MKCGIERLLYESGLMGRPVTLPTQETSAGNLNIQDQLGQLLQQLVSKIKSNERTGDVA